MSNIFWSFRRPLLAYSFLIITLLIGACSGASNAPIFDSYTRQQLQNTLLTSAVLHNWTPSDLLAIGNAQPVYFAPGKGWYYSNTNYILLGLIIEKVTESTFTKEVTSRIINHLGLNNTSIPTTIDMPPGSTQGYLWYAGIRYNSTKADPSFAWSAGNAISNNDDLAVFLTAVINGTLLNQQRKTDMFTFVNDHGVVTQGDDAKYGLGLYYFSPGWIGHSGDFIFGGQASLYWYNGWMFIVQTNASPPIEGFENGADYIWSTLVKALGLPLS